MRTIILTALAAGVVWATAPTPAEAARCAKGSIYRPSQGVCQSRASAARQGIRVKTYRSEARRARIEARREARKARTAIVAETPRTMPVTPMMTIIAPDPFMAVEQPFGRLVAPLPAAFEQHVMAWASENKHRLIHGARDE